MLDGVDIVKQKKDMLQQSNDCPQLVALFTGMIYAYASPAIPKLVSEYGFTIEDASYFPIIPPIAMLIATPIFCKLTDRNGRKYTLLTAGVFHAISWVVIAFADAIYLFYISRMFFGISDACMFAALPTYIAEVTTPKIRSSYGNIMVISSLIGQFLSNCIGYYVSIQSAAFIMLPFPILFVITFAFMPDTPYYFLKSGKAEQAMKSLQKLRGCEDVKTELLRLNLDVQRQLSESGKFKDLFLIKSNRKALAIASVSRSFQQYSGSGSLVVYAQYIFNEAGGSISSGAGAMIVSGIFAFVNLFANVICDKLGRRKSMIFSCLGCAIILLAEATYFYVQAFDVLNLSFINWFPILGLASYAVTFCIGLGVIPTLLLGEIFSTSIRQHGTMVSNIIFGANICVALKLFQLLMSTYGMWVPFLVFGLCCLVSAFCSYFIIPETKGKTLEEIQQILKGNKV
ncbi:hypothetical protein Trydic_g4150 [Trypoxylus dichotomus]